jgi:hypothetical protein
LHRYPLPLLACSTEGRRFTYHGSTGQGQREVGDQHGALTTRTHATGSQLGRVCMASKRGAGGGVRSGRRGGV